MTDIERVSHYIVITHCPMGSFLFLKKVMALREFISI